MAKEEKKAPKKEKVITRDAKGSWDVKYKWHFRSDYMERYVAALKDMKMLATKCNQCGRVYSPPATRCGRCFVELTEWTEVQPRGKVIMYTVMYNAISGEPLPEPRITAIIQLEGSSAWMIAPVKNTKPEEMHTGLAIKVVWNEARKGVLADIQHFEAVR
ncbi:MAG TPA: Zn-ribbon domain-containing OB-fold protein [bacterium]|nr:Zn-ribbon domain-containing OB-fold protein [bacterium]